jgi:hypothetical protein
LLPGLSEDDAVAFGCEDDTKPAADLVIILDEHNGRGECRSILRR